MDSRDLRAIEQRAECYSYLGTHRVEDELVPEEDISRLIQDRQALIDYIYQIGGERNRAIRRHDKLAAQLVAAQEKLRLAQTKYNLAKNLLLATASILPYRKNKAAHTIQTSVLAFLEAEGLMEDYKTMREKLNKPRPKKTKPTPTQLPIEGDT